MPFKSLAQSRAAFGGYLGKEMKSKAKEFASKTDYKELPDKLGKQIKAIKGSMKEGKKDGKKS